MARRWARRRPGYPAGEARAAPRVDDLPTPVADEGEHVGLLRDAAGVEGRREMAVPNRRPAAFQRPPFRLPLGEAAIEDCDVMGAEALQHPPDARRGVERRVV